MIILTHYHYDHTGSLPGLKKATGARVAAHRDDLPQRKLLFTGDALISRS